ncbi:MAG: hypothetical protein WBB29_14640 [Geitlerinemataceae cyanobacterium]
MLGESGLIRSGNVWISTIAITPRSLSVLAPSPSLASLEEIDESIDIHAMSILQPYNP